MGENPFKIYIFRHCFAKFSRLETHIEEIKKEAKYKKGARLEEAPNFFDCLTLVHYIFKKYADIKMPITLIGNMPRELFSSSEWKLLSVDSRELCCGDLIFFKNKRKNKLLGHIAFALGNGKILHCNSKVGTIIYESIEECMRYYSQHLSIKDHLKYIDPRDIELRNKNKGMYIQEEFR